MNIRPAQLVMFVVAMMFAMLLVLPKSREMAKWEEGGGDIYRIIARYERAVERRPRDYEARRKLAYYLSEATSFDRAETLLNEMIGEGFETPAAWRSLAHIKWRRMETAAAAEGWRRGYEAGLLSDAEFGDIIDRLRWLKDDVGLIQVLGSARGAGYRLDDERLEHLAWAHEFGGNLDRAIPIRLEIAKMRRKDGPSWSHLADLYELTGDVDSELAARRKWQELDDMYMGLELADRLGALRRTREQEALLWKLANLYPDEEAPRGTLLAFAYRGDGNEASSVMPEYIRRWPAETEAVIGYAEWLIARDREDEGRKLYRLALDWLSKRGDLDAKLARGDVLLALGLDEEAKVQFEELVELEPVEARLGLARAELRLGLTSLARQHLDEAIAIESTRELLVERAALHQLLGRYELAVSDLNEILKDHGPSENVHLALVSSYLSLGRTAEARQVLEICDVRYPESVEARLYRVRLLTDEGRPDEARRVLATVDRGALDKTPYLARAASILALELDVPGAEERAVHLLKTKPDTDLSLAYAAWLRQQGRDADLDRVLAEPLAELERKSDPLSRLQRARVLVLLDRRDEALGLYAGLESTFPLTSRLAMVDIHEASGNYEEALEILDTIISEVPGARLRLRRAQLLVSAGRHRESVPEWERALDAQPDDPLIIEGLARATLTIADHDAADRWIAMLSRTTSGPQTSRILRIRWCLDTGRIRQAHDRITDRVDSDRDLTRDNHLALALMAVECNHPDALGLAESFRDRHDPDYYLNLAYVTLLRDRGRDPEARRIMSAELNRVRDLELLVEQASALTFLGRHEEALRLYTAAFPLEDVAERAGLLSLYIGMAKIDEARVLSGELFDETGDPAYLSEMAGGLAAVGDHKGAIVLWDRAHGLGHRTDILLEGLATAYLETGRLEAADRWIRELGTRPGGERTAGVLRVRWFIDSDRLDEAGTRIEKLAIDVGDHSRANHLRLALLALSIDHETGLKLAEEFRSGHGRDHYLNMAYARKLAESGRDDSARRIVEAELEHLDGPQWAVQRADALVFLDRYDEALKIYRSISGPASLAGRVGLLGLYLTTQDVDAARKLATELHEETGNPEHLISLGQTQSAVGRFEDALATWERLTGEGVEKPEVLRGMTVALLELGRLDAAATWLKKLEATAHPVADSRILRIRLALARDDRSLAAGELRSYLEKIDFRKSREQSLAVAYLSMDLMGPLAEPHVDHYLKTFGNDADLMIAWGIRLRDLGRDKEAQAMFTAAIATLPEVPRPGDDGRRALVDMWTGNFEPAEKYFLGRVRDEPVAARRQLLQLYGMSEQTGKQREVVEKLVEIDPDRDLLMTWAFLLDGGGEPARAREVWERVDGEFGPDREARALLAGFWLARGDIRNVRPWLAKLQEDFPEDTVTHRVSAQVLVAEGRINPALAVLAPLKASGRITEDEVADRLFVTLSLQADVPEAETRARDFLEVHPRDVDVLEAYGRWLGLRGRRNEADAVVRDAIATLGDSELDTLRRARLMILLRRSEEAIVLLETLLEKHPITGREIMIQAHIQMDHPDLAVDVAEELMDLTDSRVHHRLHADMLYLASYNVSAIQAYEAYTERWGPERAVLANIVYIYLDLEMPGHARRAFTALEKHAPEASETIRLRAGFLAAEGLYEEAYHVLAPLALAGGVAPDDSLWPELLVSTGRWQRGLVAWDVLYATEPPFEWKWWNRRDPREVHVDQYLAEVTWTRGPGDQSVFGLRHWMSVFLDEDWRFEGGQGWRSYENDPPNRTNVNEWSHWVASDWRWRHDRTFKMHLGWDHLHHHGRGTVRLEQTGYEPWADWSVMYQRAPARDALEFARLDGREHRIMVQARHPIRDTPLTFFESGEYWTWDIQGRRNTITGRSEFGHGTRFRAGFEYRFTRLEYGEFPNYYMTYQYTRLDFDPEAEGLLTLVPVNDRQREHAVTLQALHRWDKEWEWLGVVGLTTDRARQANNWNLGSRLIYRTPENGRFGLGIDFGTEPTASTGGNVINYVFDLQWMF